MTSDEIVVVANDVVPGMGMPVAAPGLRAWGLARGLRAHGHAVTIALDRTVVDRAWTRPVPPPRPPGVVLARPREIGELVRARAPRAVVITNSNHIAQLDGCASSLVFDFFAPKMLELELQARPEALERQAGRLRRRKIRALRASSAVIVNGAKKVPYVEEWLQLSGTPGTRTAVVNMPLPVRSPAPPANGPVHAIVAGYIQPWSSPGRWAEAVRPFLAEGSLVLHLLVANHWGNPSRQSDPMPDNFAELVALDGVTRHGPMEYDDFCRLLSTCHLSIDLFERNPERELAMVTRTAVALSCGLPVLHVPFTETSEFIREHDAGWLVEADDLDGIRQALVEATTSPEALAGKRDGAAQVGRTLLDPAVATAPLHEILEDLG
jgi:hypothetical protein